jgi:hypothetical protein
VFNVGISTMAGKLIHFDKKSNKWEDKAEAALEY